MRPSTKQSQLGSKKLGGGSVRVAGFLFLAALFLCGCVSIQSPYVKVSELPPGTKFEFPTRYESKVSCKIISKISQKDINDIKIGIEVIKKLVPDLQMPVNPSFENIYWTDFVRYDGMTLFMPRGGRYILLDKDDLEVKKKKIFEYIKISATCLHEWNHSYFNTKDPHTHRLIDEKIQKAVEKAVDDGRLRKIELDILRR